MPVAKVKQEEKIYKLRLRYDEVHTLKSFLQNRINEQSGLEFLDEERDGFDSIVSIKYDDIDSIFRLGMNFYRLIKDIYPNRKYI